VTSVRTLTPRLQFCVLKNEKLKMKGWYVMKKETALIMAYSLAIYWSVFSNIPPNLWAEILQNHQAPFYTLVGGILIKL